MKDIKEVQEACATNSMWVQTATARSFFYVDPENDYSDISIIDICTHLARMPRGNGAWAVSVAEHSVGASFIAEALGADKHTQLLTLLHDAVEAYVGNMPAPFKCFLGVHYGINIDELEDAFQERILKALGIALPSPHQQDVINQADALSLYFERHKFAKGNLPWPYIDQLEPPEHFGYLFEGLAPNKAAAQFKERYLSLRDKKVV